MKKIIIASPHSRNDHLEKNLKDYAEIVRIREPGNLSLELLEEIRPDFVFFPHWSWIIPDEILSNFNCVIFHMTDLPYGRGGSPLQNLIVRGKKETVVSAIKCVKELDAGPVYCKKQLTLDGTAEQILSRASLVIKELIVDILSGDCTLREQTGEVVTFKRRKMSEGNIYSLDSIEKIYDYIRMLDADGYPKAFIEIENFRLEFVDSEIVGDKIKARVEFQGKDHD